jgi:hypothetical protein
MVVLPGTILKLYDEKIKELLNETAGCGLDKLRRYGYRRPDPISNPNISQAPTMISYGRTELVLNNARLSNIQIIVPYKVKYDIGDIIWFGRKNLAGMITDMNDSIIFGDRSTTSITITYLRKIINKGAATKQLESQSPPPNTKYQKFSDGEHSIEPTILYIENIPEYTFVEDFYNGNVISEASVVGLSYNDKERRPI